MKCIKKAGDIRKVSNERAYDMVREGWEYTNRTAYKNQSKKLESVKKTGSNKKTGEINGR